MSVLRAERLIPDIPGRADGYPLDFAVEPGQIWGVLGPNGAGKTTLLHTLAGLRRARSGVSRLDDRPIQQWRRRTVAQRLGVVFQERQDGFPATVLETALIGRHPYLAPWDVETAEDLEAARSALRAMELAELEDRLVNTLSGGERQRLALAVVLAQQPALWLVDEPTNHLDLRHQAAVMQLLHNQAHSGRGVFLCVHDVNLAARWCTHLLLLFPNGDACWGPAQEMLIARVLEDLYQQRLVTGEVDGVPVFLPADAGPRRARG